MNTEDKKRHNEMAKHRDEESARKPVKHFRDLDVYQNAFQTGLRVFELSKQFPNDERFALTDQIRRSSRSVCANIAEAWRKRRYTAAFISKLSDSEGEAAETQVHIEFAFRHGYISDAEFQAIDDAYERVLGQLVRMIDHPEKWVIGPRKNG
jgi:four helix bundle protein